MLESLDGSVHNTCNLLAQCIPMRLAFPSSIWSFDWSVGKGVQAGRSDNLSCFENI